MPTDHSEERATISAAADRLIANSANKPTVADLMRAAGVKRWILTHRHPDLTKEFQNSATHKWGNPELETNKATKALNALKEKHERLRTRNAELEQLVNIYAHAIEELRAENKTLTNRLEHRRKDKRSNVTPLDRSR